MAREVDQAKLPQYHGKFTFDPKTLRDNIKALKPDYDPDDPKTWPVVTSQCVQQRLGFPYVGHQQLPPNVAYERNLVDRCVSLHADKEIEVVRTNGGITKRSLFFHHFPFVYNKHGQARGFEYMHADHYIQWVEGMTGKVPETRTKGKDTPTRTPETQPDAFTEILEMLQTDRPLVTARETELLRQQLARTQEELVEERKRAAEAIKEKVDIEKGHVKELAEQDRRLEAIVQGGKLLKEGMQEALSREKAQHDATRTSLASCNRRITFALERVHQEVRRANMAEARVERRDKTLKLRDQQLSSEKEEAETRAKQVERLRTEAVAARKEAETAKEQINKIRDEMKKNREDGGLKRRFGGDQHGSQEKKTKREGD